MPARDTTIDAVIAWKHAFGEWFGQFDERGPDGKPMPHTPLKEARDYVIAYLSQVAKHADARSKENPDGSGPLGLWASADVQGAWATAKQRLRDAIRPIFQSWFDQGMPAAGWGKAPYMTATETATFWPEVERFALSVGSVFDSPVDAAITWNIYKTTVADTIKGIVPKIGDWLESLVTIAAAGFLLWAISGKD